MVATGCMKCLKYLLFAFNLLFLLAGLILIIVGAIGQATVSHAINGAAIFIIVIGCVIFVVSFFGCFGAIKENRCMLITFGVILIIIFILSVAGLIAAFALRNKARGLMEDFLEDQIKHYNPDKKITTKFMDSFQKDEKCCGVNNSTDWNANEKLTVPPDSCCKDENNCADREKKPEELYSKGCLGALESMIKRNLVIVGAVAAAVTILEVLGIILAFVLAHGIKMGYNVV